MLTCIDGAHGPGALDLNLRELGCDFYAGSGHKWLCAPSGTGILYIRRDRIADLDPHFAGACTDTGWTLTPEVQEMKGVRDEANRYSYGTQSNLHHAGLAAAVKFMSEIGLPNVEARHHELHTYLRGLLQGLPQVEILTPEEKRSHGAILTFRVAGKDVLALNKAILKKNVRPRVVLESNLNAIRISPHIYNNEADLDRLVEVLKEEL